MSTRSVIIVTGQHIHNGASTVRLYKHSDGYPTGNLPIIADAIEKALTQCKEHQKEWKEKAAKPINVTQVAGHIIGEATTVYGMGADFEGFFEEAFNPLHLGEQQDLEWLYVLDLDKKTLSIYGGGYTGEAPQKAYRRGFADPMGYAKCLYEQYQDGERKRTKEFLGRVEALGFKVNPESKAKKSSKKTSLKAVARE